MAADTVLKDCSAECIKTKWQTVCQEPQTRKSWLPVVGQAVGGGYWTIASADSAMARLILRLLLFEHHLPRGQPVPLLRVKHFTLHARQLTTGYSMVHFSKHPSAPTAACVSHLAHDCHAHHFLAHFHLGTTILTLLVVCHSTGSYQLVTLFAHSVKQNKCWHAASQDTSSYQFVRMSSPCVKPTVGQTSMLLEASTCQV